MKHVNKYMLSNLLAPLGGTADIDEEINNYTNFENNNEILVKHVIANEIKPYYYIQSDLYKESVKRSLAYFLTTDKINYGDLYDNCLIAFDHPKDPRSFFLWIWEVLFPFENYYITNTENYIEVENPNEANSYLQ
ncbi:hypothetical protein [Lacibacter sp. H407]|jgi:hypothetical protein|uniref:hypothetical protein n=1 Tax=Lacibacter sp. H407 TaxID=3133423 RepID=UPI0030C1BAE0